MTSIGKAASPVTHRSGRPAGAVAVAGGLFSLIAVTLLLQAVLGQMVPPVVVFEVLFLVVAAGLLRRSRPAVRWAAVVLPAMLVIANLPFALADLRHPESAVVFVLTLAVLTISLATVVLAVRHARRAPVPGRSAWTVATVVMLLGTVVAAVQATRLEDDVALAGDAVVVVADLSYPERLDVSADSGILLDNTDPYRHTFVVQGTDVAVELPAATARRVPLALAPGEYRYYCDVPGHEGMEGILQVAFSLERPRSPQRA